MSLFVAANCQVVADTAVNSVSWCRGDSLAALTAYTIDDQDREVNKVLFVNNEVEFFVLVLLPT